MDGEEVCACRIAAGYYEVGTNVALIAEEVLFEESHDGDYARLAACGECVQFEIGGNDGGRELCVGGGSGSCTPDLRRDVVKLLTVLRDDVLVADDDALHADWHCMYLVGDDGTACGSGISGDDNAAIV